MRKPIKTHISEPPNYPTGFTAITGIDPMVA